MPRRFLTGFATVQDVWWHITKWQVSLVRPIKKRLLCKFLRVHFERLDSYRATETYFPVDFAIHSGGGSYAIVIPDAENLIGPADISHLPQLHKPQDQQPSTSGEPTRRKGRTAKAALITSSPYRKELRDSLDRASKGKAPACKKLFGKGKKPTTTTKQHNYEAGNANRSRLVMRNQKMNFRQ